MNPGTDVGFVRERIGDTNIALAQLHENVTFDNNFMETDCTPKRFLRSEEQHLGDQYVIDSFATGKQRLFVYGERLAIGRRGREPRHNIWTPQGMEHLAPLPIVAYIKLEQKVCTTNTPIMNSKPYIRDGACGAVLLRVRRGKLDKASMKEAEKDVTARGEIGGMMHFADLQEANTSGAAEAYFIYADAFDPLMDQGWTIVQPSSPESHQAPPPQEASKQHEQKRKKPGRDRDDDNDESLTKKQRGLSGDASLPTTRLAQMPMSSLTPNPSPFRQSKYPQLRYVLRKRAIRNGRRDHATAYASAKPAVGSS